MIGTEMRTKKSGTAVCGDRVYGNARGGSGASYLASNSALHVDHLLAVCVAQPFEYLAHAAKLVPHHECLRGLRLLSQEPDLLSELCLPAVLGKACRAVLRSVDGAGVASRLEAAFLLQEELHALVPNVHVADRVEHRDATLESSLDLADGLECSLARLASREVLCEVYADRAELLNRVQALEGGGGGVGRD